MLLLLRTSMYVYPFSLPPPGRRDPAERISLTCPNPDKPKGSGDESRRIDAFAT
jgi:hypothetical protein